MYRQKTSLKSNARDLRENSSFESVVVRFPRHVHLKRADKCDAKCDCTSSSAPLTNIVSLRNAPSDGLAGMRSWLPSLGSPVVQRGDGWRGVLMENFSSRFLPFSVGRVFLLLALAQAAGESTRGCRLEADKIREESRLSNPRWLSSPLVSLPLREDLAAGKKRDAARLARTHWIGGQLYRFAFSIMALVIRVQYIGPNNM